jgi:hypothetical protein
MFLSVDSKATDAKARDCTNVRVLQSSLTLQRVCFFSLDHHRYDKKSQNKKHCSTTRAGFQCAGFE